MHLLTLVLHSDPTGLMIDDIQSPRQQDAPIFSMYVSDNILTSPVLETLRKIDQADPDENIGNESNKAILFVPILKISEELNQCKSLLNELSTIKDVQPLAVRLLKDIKDVLDSSEFQDKIFKKIFNRYSDNIFYSNSDQANLYLGGGSLPDSRQTQQYMLRNDVLTGIQNVRDDVYGLLTNGLDEQSLEDALDDVNSCLSSLEEYMSLCDPQDVALAMKILRSKR